MKIIDDDGQVIAEGHTLTIDPCDVLVFSTDRRLDMDTRNHLVDQLARVFRGHKAVVLERGDELSVLRSKEVPA